MPLTLTVDEPRWTGHLRDVIARTPGPVPVAKGNGYGFGLCRLARRAGTLGADTLAVGTYDEVAAARKEFSGSVLVLSPWRPFLQRTSDDDDVIHTVGRPQDLTDLSSSGRRPRVVLEGLTSMHRHRMSVHDLTRADTSRVRLEGLALHLAPDRARLEQVEPWLVRDRRIQCRRRDLLGQGQLGLRRAKVATEVSRRTDRRYVSASCRDGDPVTGSSPVAGSCPRSTPTSRSLASISTLSSSSVGSGAPATAMPFSIPVSGNQGPEVDVAAGARGGESGDAERSESSGRPASRPPVQAAGRRWGQRAHEHSTGVPSVTEKLARSSSSSGITGCADCAIETVTVPPLRVISIPCSPSVRRTSRNCSTVRV